MSLYLAIEILWLELPIVTKGFKPFWNPENLDCEPKVLGSAVGVEKQVCLPDSLSMHC